MFIFVIGAALILSPVTYAMMMACIISLATNEYCKMIKAEGQHPHFFLALAINLVAFSLGFLVYFQGIDPRSILSLIVLLWAVFLVELFSQNDRPIYNIGLTLLCNIYIGLPLALLNLVAFKNGAYDYRPIIAMFILSWVNDTGAYLCGVTMGRHKLFERISPKKTIEGFIGGVALTVGVSVLMWYLNDLYCESTLSLEFCIACGIIMSVVGTCGDLIESMFKRSVNIKDSGNILPGHGGVLDRFDALIFAAPIVSLLYYFFI